jgi:hypothetical protein
VLHSLDDVSEILLALVGIVVQVEAAPLLEVRRVNVDQRAVDFIEKEFDRSEIAKLSYNRKKQTAKDTPNQI